MSATAPTLGGSGHPGAQIEVKDQDGKSLGTTTVAEDGTWSLTPTSDLAKGPNQLTAVQTPKDGGETSEASATITVNVVDQLAVSGPTAGSTVTTDKPVVTGTSEPRTEITITDKNGEIIGTTTANAKGEWSITLPAQPNGTVEITVTDEHGQKVDHSFTVDVAAPIAELIITGPKEGATVDTDTPNVTGTAQPGAKVTVTGKDGETLAETTAGEDGKWSVDLPKLPNGTHEITVKDDNGKSDEVSFVVNAITPIQLTGPESSESKRPVVTGTGHPGSNIELKDVLGKTIGIGTVAADGKWSITPTGDLGKGANVVTAHQTAPGGKTSEATGTIQVTVKDPLVVTGPTPGAVVESETPNVSGTAEPGSKITVTGPDGEKLGETTTDENGDWSLQLPVMPEGETSITVTDEHGGKVEIEFTVPEHFDDEQDADAQADPGASSTTNGANDGSDANVNASASAAASAKANGDNTAAAQAAAIAAALADATSTASAAATPNAVAAAQAAATTTASTNASQNTDSTTTSAANAAATASADSTSTSAANANASAASESNAAASAKSAATTTSSSDAGSQAAGQASAAGATSNTQGANSGSNSNDRANANAAASAAATAKADDNSNASVKGAAEAAAYADNTSQASAAADISAEAAAKAAATPTASSDTTANLTSASNSAAEAAARAAAQADNSSSANASASQRATTNANAASKSAAITNASSNAGANAGGTNTGKTKWKRLGGANRFETAVQVSKDSYPRGAKSVVIARSDLAPDALSAAPFAVKQNAPVLLTPPTSLVKETKAEIKRLKASTVYIAGGNGAISASVEAEIRGMGVKIVRMAGSDRYETSLKIAQTGWKNGTEKAFVATGRDYPDALSAGSAAGATGVPVILVDGKTGLTGTSRAALGKYGTKHLYIAGGNGAVAPSIETAMRGSGKTVERFAGGTRYETSAAIAKQWHTKGGLVYLATGVDFPDALAGSAVAGAQSAPIMLTMKNCVPKPVKDTITGTIKPQAGVVLGGKGVITDRVLNSQPTC